MPGKANSRLANYSNFAEQRFQYVWPDFFKTIVTVLSDGELHDVDEVRSRVISAHAISQEQLKITQADGLKSLFVNTVGHALARLTATGGVIRQSSKGGTVGYRMTPKGLAVVGRVGLDRVTITHFLPSTGLSVKNR